VILDTQAPGNNRKITAFLGGLDLCDGRYDTPDHRLFHDLDTVYQGDFHNPILSVSSIANASRYCKQDPLPNRCDIDYYYYLRYQRDQENHGMICTAKLMDRLHMMCLRTLSSAGERQQNGL